MVCGETGLSLCNSGLLLKMSDPRVNGIDKTTPWDQARPACSSFLKPAPARSFALRMTRFHSRNRYSVIAYQYRTTGVMWQGPSAICLWIKAQARQRSLRIV